jgi:HlyD family secretion protein
MRRLLRWLITLAILAGLGVLLVRGLRPKPPVIQVVRASRGPIIGTVSTISSGIVEPRKRVSVQAESFGRVIDVRVKRGDRVKAGQVLVVLNAEDLRDQVRSQSAAVPLLEVRVQQARTRLEQTKVDLERISKLAERGVASRQQLDTAKSARDLADHELSAARAALDQTRVNLGVTRGSRRKTLVKAPFDGAVLDVFAEVGEQASSVSGGSDSASTGGSSVTGSGSSVASSALSALSTTSQRGLVDLADDSEMYVLGDIDELDYGRLHKGQSVQLTFDALRKRVMYGELAEVFPYVARNAEQNRTIRVKVRLPDEAHGLVLPGMSANVEVITERREQALVVPTSCVLARPNAKVVLRVEGDHLVEVPVKIGLSNWEKTEILSGASDGTQLAVPSTDVRLEGGMKVRLAGEAPATPSKTPAPPVENSAHR